MAAKERPDAAVAFSPSTVMFLEVLSRLIGWIYTFAWSLSFYPQIILNIRRRSTSGTTPSFPTLGLLGFLCYTASAGTFYFSSVVQEQYRQHNNGEENTVRGNDVVFGVHASVLCAITLSQYWPWLWRFESNGRRRATIRIGKGTWGIVVGCLLWILWVTTMVLKNGKNGRWEWLDLVYSIGYVKLVVTVVKYIPQVWANYIQQSTEGWSISQITMDFTGGIFSTAQLLIDSSLQKDWSGLTGNPVKFALGNISIVFDIIFMVQHFILYRRPVRSEKVATEDESQSLLSNRDEEARTE